MSSTYDTDFQFTIAALLLRDSSFAAQVEGLVEADYFEHEGLHFLVRIHNEYWNRYHSLMGNSIMVRLIKQAVDTKRLRGDKVDLVKEAVHKVLKADVSGVAFTVDAVSEFARNQAVETALMASVDLLDKKDFPKIQEVMSNALGVGANEDIGSYDHEENMEARLERRRELLAGTAMPTGISTGHIDMDRSLNPHRGFGRGELSLIMGGAKSGKTTAMIHFGVKAAKAGHNVLYASCEVSNEIIADRIDANICGIPVKELKQRIPETESKLKAFYAGTKGKILSHQYPSGTLTPSQLRRLIKRYRSKGVIFDMIIVDYADIMTSDSHHKEERHKLNEIYLALRAISSEENAAVLTATQSTRTGQKKAQNGVADETDLAEDFNKARHCDVMFSINQSEQNRMDNEVRLYFALVRNDESGFTLTYGTDRAKMRFLTDFIGRDGL